MADFQIFSNPEFGEIRTIERDGEPCFVGKDVAQALGYSDTNKAIAMHVDEEDKLNDKTASSLGQRGGEVSGESGGRGHTGHTQERRRRHMNELITVTYENDRPAVSARDLHALLEVGADFRHWFPRMCEYGFEAGRDFNPVKIDRVQNEGGRTVTRTVDDAILTP